MFADILSILRYSAIALLAVSWFCLNAEVAQAASSGQPAIVAASEIRVDSPGPMPLNLRVEAAETLPPQTVLTLRGVPPSVELTAGKQFSPGVWVVPLGNVAKLKMVVLTNEPSKTELSIALVSLDGTSLSESKMTLVLGPQPVMAAAAGKTAPVTAALVTPIKPQPRPLTSADRDLALKLKAKGDQGMFSGDILSARPLYKAAADRGLPEAAMALAATYDPAELATLKGIVGVVPSAAEARKWYEKAEGLGAPEAAARLQRLAN